MQYKNGIIYGEDYKVGWLFALKHYILCF